MTDTRQFTHLVVVGTSAGGLDAVGRLLSSLPPDFRAPIVIAQHLDPDRPSHLGTILARETGLPVRTVDDRERLQAAVVYVVPPNRNVEIVDGEVRVSDRDRQRTVPSIDRLLKTAAEAYGEKVIGVILTGTGSDGAAGARAVKAAEGTIIIQNPSTARYPGMPESVAPALVDIVADVEDIGAILVDLVSGASRAALDTDERLLRTFLDQLRDRTGIDFASYKRPTVLRRLSRRVAATGTTSLREYIGYAQRHPEEYERLVSSFLIKVTEFFRDPELFAYLQEQILPEVIASARERGGELRLWSAGCATGEEAYSLAMVVAELLGEEFGDFDLRIFATDLDSRALAFARHGVYPTDTLDKVPAALRDRYFVRVGDSYEVRKTLRSRLVFGQHDLGQRAPFPRIDLILCRNVLIYFTPELQRRALQLFAFSLRDAGYLVLGKAETIAPAAESFQVAEPHLKVYRRSGARVLLPAMQIRATATFSVPHIEPSRLLLSNRPWTPGNARDAEQMKTSRDRAYELRLGLPVGVVVVDRSYDIQGINSAARSLLGIHGPAIGDDLIHVVQFVDLAALREAIEAAFRDEQSTGRFETVTVSPLGESRYLEIGCYRQRLEPVDHEGGDAVVLVIRDVTASVEEQRRLEPLLEERLAEVQWLSEQIERLSQSNRQLLRANQELTRANAELRSANDELLIAHEEVEAAAEEVETLNEEMQASNEELETLNEELQATVEELNATNDDLEARSVELQDLAVSLEEQRRQSEAERARLSAVLSGMSDAVVVVDPTGHVVLTNEAYDQIFGTGNITPEDEDGRPIPAHETPLARAARGEVFNISFTLPRVDGSRRWFEASGHLSGGEGVEQGGVVVIRDITERSLHRLQEQFLALAGHELRTPLVPLQGYLQILAQRLEQAGADEHLQRYARVALDQVRRLGTLVDEMVELTRLQTGRFKLQRERVDLVTVVQETVELVQAAAPQRIHVEEPTTSAFVEGDPTRLSQIVLNLLMNAVRYAAGTQRIDVRLGVLDGQAELQVQDYGPGIPPDELHNLFTRFYQTRSTQTLSGGGLGLGLYIVKQLVDAHGGTTDVASTPGEGATFTVRLPLAE